MVLFYKIWKNFNEIQLTKTKMDLNNLKIIQAPPLQANKCCAKLYNNYSVI